MKITGVHALEILDSRGNPTLEATVLLQSGAIGTAQVPSGKSTGKHEAHELRDGDSARFNGKGVLKAVANIENTLGPAVVGFDAADQPRIDARLIEIDGTGNKRRLGANAILAISCAVARAAAQARHIPLWKHLSGLKAGARPSMPVPMINIISGGHHALGEHRAEFQDFMVIPRGYPDLSSALEAVVRVHGEVRQAFTLDGVADEGGWGPDLENNEAGVAALRTAIERAGATMDIALDVAASHFAVDGIALLLEQLIDGYSVVSIEDPLPEDDWDGWTRITPRLGSRVCLVGDDFFATNLARLEEGIARGAANSILIKMNQIGTLTETLAVIARAAQAGYGAVISARSGETEDSFLADLAVASGAGRIKIGSITRSERLAKYNRLLEIEKWELE